MKILHLTLYKKWFDLILSGKKTIEYRRDIPYWRKRLFVTYPFDCKLFDQIHFRNGYGKTRPLVKTEHCSTIVDQKTKVILIYLGDIIK